MRLRLKGGYNVPLAGRPSAEIRPAPETDTLFLPLASRRFAFTQSAVRDGQEAAAGTVLATDPAHFGLPLLAPRAGTVRLGALEGHIVLEHARLEEPERMRAGAGPVRHSPQGDGGAAARREALVRLGAWMFFEDAHTGGTADPSAAPQAVVVSTVRLEPFLARGDVQLAGRGLERFARGLEHLQSLLEYQPMYLVAPEVEAALAERLHESLRGHAWLQIVTVRPRYPFDHPALLARALGLAADGGPVWALRTEGVLAVERALGEGLPATERTVALGGPAVREPMHLALPVGYPLEKILLGALADGPPRVICGGALTGDRLDHAQKGLDAETTGLTVLAEPKRRELFGWLRPGWNRASYSRCFASALRRPRPEALTTALRGEGRACIACGQCERVCPARILPHLIHKALYEGAIDEAERLGVDLCVACGLCAHVCPSKLELRSEFLEAQQQLREERAHAAAAGEARP